MNFTVIETLANQVHLRCCRFLPTSMHIMWPPHCWRSLPPYQHPSCPPLLPKCVMCAPPPAALPPPCWPTPCPLWSGQSSDMSQVRYFQGVHSCSWTCMSSAPSTTSHVSVPVSWTTCSLLLMRTRCWEELLQGGFLAV